MPGLNTKTKKQKRNWALEVLPHIKKQIEEFDEQGIVPTLRTIFYRLVSRGIIRNVQSDYAYLSTFTTKCRKRSVILDRLNMKKVIEVGLPEEIKEIMDSYKLIIKYNRQRHNFTDNIILDGEYGKKYVLKIDEVLPVACFADETRGVYKEFTEKYETPEQLIGNMLDFLKELPDKYKYTIPKWHEQAYYVELWTEKSAMVGTFESILRGHDVRIVFNRGFDSVSNTWQTYQRIKKAWKEGKKVRILYFGDLDPSGDAMDEIINESMNVCFNVEKFKERGDYDFKRVGVFFEHIDKFKLPKNLDDEVLAKLKKDMRKEQFKEKYNLKSDDELFQIEIDALAASNAADFKKMVLDAIKPFYDEEVYQRNLSDVKHSNEHISRLVMKNVQKFVSVVNIRLIDEFKIESMWNWLES
jgi:hypothetical protein